VVGIRGTLNRPEFSRIDAGGKAWIIEGYGVDPDIVQDNDPAREFALSSRSAPRGESRSRAAGPGRSL
jgi:hypothetical protein